MKKYFVPSTINSFTIYYLVKTEYVYGLKQGNRSAAQAFLKGNVYTQ